MPKSIKFQLNTTAGCSQYLAKGSDTGITDSFCLIREAKVVSDLVLVSVNTIKIFELKEDLATVGYPTVVSDANNGDLIDFSFSNSTDSIGGIQFMIKGVNKNGTTVSQDSIVAFTNDCNALVFKAGDQVGFLTIVSENDHFQLVKQVYYILLISSNLCLDNPTGRCYTTKPN